MKRKSAVATVTVLAMLLTVGYILRSDNSVTCLFNPTTKSCYGKIEGIKVAKDNIYQKHAIMDTDNNHQTYAKKKRKVASSLEEDLKRCSLAMGMSKDELRELPRVAKKAQVFLDTLQSVWPQHFSPNFKNPCWYPNFTLTPSIERTIKDSIRVRNGKHILHRAEISTILDNITAEFNTEHRKLFCLPNFFLAGFPKSGTTSLHATLSKHPQILRPNMKEPHWWTRITLGNMGPDFLKLVAIRYLLYFSSAATEMDTNESLGQTITYDGTQSLLWDSNFLSDVNHLDYCVTPAIVSRILPDAKFIVLMRNPVAREYSNFFYLCDEGALKHIPEGPTSHFHRAASKVINTLNTCLEAGNNSLPWCIGKINPLEEGCGYIGGRFTIGLYYVHLLKWFQFYPRENFLFLRTEDMSKEPHKTMTQITQFLGVDEVSESDAEQWLSKEANVQHVYPKKYQMTPETKKLLEDFYEPYNELLANLLGDERFLWT